MHPPQRLRIGDLSEGSSAIVTFSITAEQLLQFAELSGDFNPLHLDDTFARAKGYEGKVVYGALLVSKISQLIGMHLPGENGVWASIAFDFKRPLYVGQAAEVEGRVLTLHATTGMVELGLVLRAEGRILGKGKAEVILGG